MTTVGTEDGRNYARVNLKLAERAKRSALAEGARGADPRRAPARSRASSSRSASTGRSGSTCSVPIRTRCRSSSAEFAAKVAKVPGIADLETSDKAANPALSIRLNNDAASDLGITVQQVGATIRPLLAGDTVSYWLGPDGQNYEVNVQLSKDSRRLASDLGNLYLTSNKRGPDGQMRMVPLRQVAELVETTSPQIIKRQDLQRRIGIYANAEGRPAGDVGNDVQKIAYAMDLPPGYRLGGGGPAAGHAGVVLGRGRRARARDHLHLPDPRVAVRELHAAGGDHGVAAVLADRRVPRAAADAARRSTSSRSSASSC